MQIPKPTAADNEYFRSIVPDDPRVVIKPMFGNLGGFVNGNMFMGLFGSDLGLRLPPADVAAVMAMDGAGPYGPAERPMGGWVSLPAALRHDATTTATWVERALDHIAAMPPKAARKG